MNSNVLKTERLDDCEQNDFLQSFTHLNLANIDDMLFCFLSGSECNLYVEDLTRKIQTRCGLSKVSFTLRECQGNILLISGLYAKSKATQYLQLLLCLVQNYAHLLKKQTKSEITGIDLDPVMPESAIRLFISKKQPMRETNDEWEKIVGHLITIWPKECSINTEIEFAFLKFLGSYDPALLDQMHVLRQVADLNLRIDNPQVQTVEERCCAIFHSIVPKKAKYNRLIEAVYFLHITDPSKKELLLDEHNWLEELPQEKLQLFYNILKPAPIEERLLPIFSCLDNCSSLKSLQVAMQLIPPSLSRIDLQIILQQPSLANCHKIDDRVELIFEKLITCEFTGSDADTSKLLLLQFLLAKKPSKRALEMACRTMPKKMLLRDYKKILEAIASIEQLEFFEDIDQEVDDVLKQLFIQVKIGCDHNCNFREIQSCLNAIGLSAQMIANKFHTKSHHFVDVIVNKFHEFMKLVDKSELLLSKFARARKKCNLRKAIFLRDLLKNLTQSK